MMKTTPSTLDELAAVGPATKDADKAPVEQYCYVYNDLLVLIYSLNDFTSAKLISCICQHLTVQDKGKIALLQYMKERIAGEIGREVRSVNRAITELKKCRFLIADPQAPKSNIYYVNPLLVWKGDQEGRRDIMKFLKLKPVKASQYVRDPASKRARVKVKEFEIDLSIPLEKRRKAAKRIVVGLQRELGYENSFCKKFFEYYSIQDGETTEGQPIMRFEGEALKRRGEFQWEWKLKDWHRREKPVNVGKDQELESRLKQAQGRSYDPKDYF